MPVTMTRPRAARMASTAATKGAPSPSDIAAANAAMPSDSVASVRSAEAMWGPAAEFGLFIFARALTRNSDPNSSIERPNDPSLVAPSRKGISESAVAGLSFFQGQNGAPAIVVDNRNIEPRPLFKKLNIALQVGVDRGQA